MTEFELPDLAEIPTGQRASCLAACDEILECYRVLNKGGLNVVGEVLREQGPFYEFDHYPKHDVYDRDYHAQYYYHAHRDRAGEHGHFHLFVRSGAMPEEQQPELGPEGDQRVAHLVAIAMDAWGFPIELFAVNRWVTDESWFPAGDVIALLDHFVIDHAAPSWPVNRWITAMVRCYRPQIEALLRHRDRVVEEYRKSRALTTVLEDRRLEVTGSVVIDVENWRQQLLEADTQASPLTMVG